MTISGLTTNPIKTINQAINQASKQPVENERSVQTFSNKIQFQSIADEEERTIPMPITICFYDNNSNRIKTQQ